MVDVNKQPRAMNSAEMLIKLSMYLQLEAAMLRNIHHSTETTRTIENGNETEGLQDIFCIKAKSVGFDRNIARNCLQSSSAHGSLKSLKAPG